MMDDKKILEEMLTVIMTQSFLDGYLEMKGLYGKSIEDYTLEEKKIYQQGERLAQEYTQPYNDGEDKNND